MKKRVAVVHVGLEKTGSTAIQHWLKRYHQALLDQGIVMPRSLGFPNHTRLVAACLDDGVVDNLKAHLLRREALSEPMLRCWVEASLATELSRAPDWHTLLITSELISSRLSSPTEIARLLALLRPHVDYIRFLLVLRRQDQLAVSRFSSVLRSGFNRYEAVLDDLSPFNFRELPPGRCVSDDLFFYDFEAIASRFASFPESELLIRCYGQLQPTAMMADVLGLSLNALADGAPRVNSAMSADAQFVIARLNQEHVVQWPSGLRREAYCSLLRRIEREVLGAPRLVTRAEAEEFLQPYLAGNGRLSERYGLGSQLHSGGFDRYPLELNDGDLEVRTRHQLMAYQAEARALPLRESLAQRLNHRFRGLKHRLRLWRERPGVSP